jgi:hypothetical protein
VETLKKLEAYAKKGGKIVATGRAPSSAPGLIGAEEQGREICAISKSLFEGRVVEEAQLGAALHKQLQPDMALSTTVPEIGFIHRHTDSAEIYFIANTGNEPKRATAKFRVSGMQAEWWDPFTGEATPVRGAIELDLEPYGSRVLVFSKRSQAAPAVAKASSKAPNPLELSAGWNVTFSGLNRKSTMDRLHSWTDDSATQFYSGEAIYEKTVKVPADFVQPGRKLLLDFGQSTPTSPAQGAKPGMRAWLDGPVREAAVVYVNGQRAGSAWRPPYAVDVTKLLKAGDNAIRIVVANTAINRMAGVPLPDYTELEKKYGSRFEPQDMNNLKPLPSGLLGGLRLVAQ